MTTGELINLLQGYDPDTPLIFSDDPKEDPDSSLEFKGIVDLTHPLDGPKVAIELEL